MSGEGAGQQLWLNDESGVEDRVRQPNLSREAQLLLATLNITSEPGCYRIGLKECLRAHLGLRLRQGEGLSCVRRLVGKKSAEWNETDQDLTVSADESSPTDAVLRDLATRLAEIAWRPLTPKLLLTALHISTRERLRWTKDGRLRTSGKLLIRNGVVAFSVPTYPVSVVEQLANTPDVLSSWRAQDSLHQFRQ